MRHAAWIVVGVVIFFAPAPLPAQQPARSLEQLSVLVSAGETVWLTDTAGREIKGRLTRIGPGGIVTLLLGGFRLLRAMWQSRSAIRSRRPAVVFSTGGYVAVPAGLAASTANVPLALLNADAAPLLSTRLLRSLASAVFCGFDGAAAHAAGGRGLVTGNPVRAEIAALPPPAQRYAGRQGPLKRLVIGGSLGSQMLNETVPAALALLPEESRPAVVHQCGGAHEQATRAAYERAAVAADVLPFIDDMAHRYGEADVVICRAGAVTVTELGAAGVASLLVPLVVSTTSHQRSNAEFMAARGAAIHLPQAELSAGRLAGVLRDLTREGLLEMASRARSLGRPEATRIYQAGSASERSSPSFW